MPDDERAKRRMWDHGHGPGRIEGLTDGLLAIAMTILALELSLDEHLLEAIAEGHFTDIGNEIFTYIMGFLVLGVYWVLHHYMFHFIRRGDGVIAWLNIVFLMLASLVPLTTKVQRLYPESGSAYLFYFVSMVLALFMLLLMWLYATGGRRLVDADLDGMIVDHGIRIIVVGPTAMLFVMIGWYFEPLIGWLGFVVLGYMIVATSYGHHKPFID